ncbi:MAG: glucose 1-dehydrogenase [Burkholderiales bacterium]|nr:glucose 1-dehydrogenase [Burkholderiales bacterium]
MLTSRIILITGAAGGIGRATALAVARAGGAVFATDQSGAGAEATAAAVRKEGARAAAHTCNVADEKSVQAMVAAAVEEFGRIDGAFNNAGIEGAPDAAATLAEADFDRVMAVNVKGVWLSMKHELAHMLPRGQGVIVNTASIAGLVGTTGYAAYNASKHAVTGLTKSAAISYAARGVRVNAVCPGFIDTEMTGRIFADQAERKAGLLTRIAQGRFGAAEEIANAVVWMLSDAARYMNGHLLTVDGGYVAM